MEDIEYLKEKAHQLTMIYAFCVLTGSDGDKKREKAMKLAKKNRDDIIELIRQTEEINSHIDEP